ncbi:Hsp70-like protein [Purpureocillium lavendulum]|uniref:Hsp70-like protein n=1 Tax=Purpureocillium lavendulum TaxID=1247861 RepID=A0AB34FYM1_9HYPO|nr:Hsp70-like protein [Purpureocillium lavendulum]
MPFSSSPDARSHLVANAVLSNARQIFADATADQRHIFGSRDDVFDEKYMCLPPRQVSQNILNEIPKGDWTYRSLGDALIPHKRFHDTWLLEYRTFQGALAYQPCSMNIDSMGLFDALSPIEPKGDPIFKQARTWSCIVQSRLGLPKELRWVLATIYNFSNEVLRTRSDEQTVWEMRAWLMHWYTVADKLFGFFGILANSPEVDWFSRPCVDAGPDPQQSCNRPAKYCSKGTDSSSAGTIIRHFNVYTSARNEDHHQVQHSRASNIQGWLAAQEYMPLTDNMDFFDPAPGGYASQRLRSSSGGMRRSRDSSTAATSALNPNAAVFTPGPPPSACSYSEQGSEEDSASERSSQLGVCVLSDQASRLDHFATYG